MGKTLVEAVQRVNDTIDRYLEHGKEAGLPALDAAMLDKVYRPYCVMMAVNRAAKTDAEQFVEASSWLLGSMIAELVSSTVDKTDADAVAEQANNVMKKMAENLRNTLGPDSFELHKAVDPAKMN